MASPYKNTLDKIVWSFSTLHMYELCPYSFYLYKIEEREGTSNFYAENGKVMHKIFQLLEEEKISLDEAPAKYLAFYNQIIDYTKMSTMDKIFDSCLDYLCICDDTFLKNYEVIWVERKLSFKIGSRNFIGFVDLLLRNKLTDDLILVDHKSSPSFFKKDGSILKSQELLSEQYEKEENQSPERLEGLKYEISQIVESGTADYFLDDYHIIKLATSVDYGGQLTTTSRGSASSYYTSKLLGFTTMDRFESEVPIYPERFITKERIQSSHQMPDVDLNCAAQEPFVGASKSLLGEDGCYPLLAVGKFGEKSGFKLYADIKGIPPSIANRKNI